jgi:3-dehydroquinate synthase
MPTRLHVDVPHAHARGYDVIIGSGTLEDVPARVAAAAPAAVYALITPDDVVEPWGRRLAAAMLASGLPTELITTQPGEAHKTRDEWARLTDRMLELGCGRDCCVIAVGGGVTGDLAGFVAATYMRGVSFVQVPTSLLAMVDACVGGKTGVDTAYGKNLIGAFHTPRLVVIDPHVLSTLPLRELRAGLAEAVKHGAILDEAYFDWIEAHADAILALDDAALEQLIARSVELKAGIVMDDVFEHGRRAILNFGHTVGHALELRAAYALPHGFAVAEGMIAEAALGERAGVTEAGTQARMARVLAALGLPASASADITGLLESMRLDKKSRAGRPRVVLLERVGSVARDADGAWTHELNAEAAQHAIDGA